MKPFARGLMIAAVVISFVAGLTSMPSQTTNAQAVTWTVSVFSDSNLSNQVWTGTTGAINYSWGQGAPIIANGEPASAPVDGFSVRFSTTAFFTAGTYRFTMQVDDGGRANVDGIPVINSWQGGSVRTLQQDYTFPTDGNHIIVVEMFDVTAESTIIFNWAIASGTIATQSGATGSTWYAEYFSNTELSGSAAYTTSYPASGLNLNWGTGFPGGTLPADNFSARFTRTLNVPTDMAQGVYTFYISTDDAFRFYVDQTLILDHWGGFENQVFQSDVTLLNGSHTFKLEYREFTSTAFVFLTWNPPSAQNPVVAVPSGGVLPGGTSGGVTAPTSTPAITGITAIVNANVLNVRATPDPAGQVLLQVRKGASYPVSGRSADSQWVQLNMGGQLGWVMAQYVALNGPIAILPVVTTTGTVPTTTVGGATVTPAPVIGQPTGVRGMVLGNLRVRSGPGTRNPQIGLMPWGTNVDILGRDGGHSWYQINFNGLIGWAYAPWIKITQGTFDALPYLDGTQPMYQPAPPTSGVIAAAYGNMRIRSGPGFQYPKIARAVWGTEVQVLARSTNLLWWKVRLGDVVGWTYGTWYRTVQGDVMSLPISDQ